MTSKSRSLIAAGIVLIASAILLAFFFAYVTFYQELLPPPGLFFYGSLFALAGLSFYLSYRNPKRAYVIAVLVVLVAGGIVALAATDYQSSLSDCLGPCDSPSSISIDACGTSGTDTICTLTVSCGGLRTLEGVHATACSMQFGGHFIFGQMDGVPVGMVGTLSGATGLSNLHNTLTCTVPSAAPTNGTRFAVTVALGYGGSIGTEATWPLS